MNNTSKRREKLQEIYGLNHVQLKACKNLNQKITALARLAAQFCLPEGKYINMSSINKIDNLTNLGVLTRCPLYLFR